ncbi:MAG: ATP-binding cassette domain-containing protein [Clostridia bacterium]|nr:ATP-binding cassette domain-containing protein [Clostridia bacterium]
MLEIRNVTKLYKGKKGSAEVRALDGVSVSFGETGLVFIVGKSGSGKSTLLNIAGGLDSATEGEILVYGKSSVDFTEADFDGYRNTYVGFVFQEYNVLDEFTVEENVALALELQGRGKDRELVGGILAEVGLSDFAKRKPGTLSGGQKQRVAIARALVKDPRIIMADEPTGALDSETGVEVLETLRKLSETRLVLVVSHDTEFAGRYADRIVELKDGKIVSDTAGREIAPVPHGNGVTFRNADTMSVKGGVALSDDDFGKIRDFILSHEGGVVISAWKKEGVGEMNVPVAREIEPVFADTAPKDFTAGTAQDTEFVRSRLPAKVAFRMGVSGLKLKPVRLVVTILLSLVAFVLFGLFSTLMLYDDVSVFADSLASSDYGYLEIMKYGRTISRVSNPGGGDSYYSVASSSAYFTQEEIDGLGIDGAFGVSSFSWTPENVTSDGGYYYGVRFSGAAFVPEGGELREKVAYGRYPEVSDEICVSSYVAESMWHSTYFDVGDGGDGAAEISSEGERIETIEDVVGKKLVYGETDVFTICGIFDSGDVSSEYDSLKTEYDSKLYMKFSDYLSDSKLFRTMLVSEDFADAYRSDIVKDSRTYNYFNTASHSYRIASAGGGVTFSGTNYFRRFDAEEMHLGVHFFDGNERDVLGDDEVILPLYWFYYGSAFSEWFEKVCCPDPDDYDPSEREIYEEDLETARALFDEVFALIKCAELGYYDETVYDESVAGTTVRHYLSGDELGEVYAGIGAFFEEYPIEVSVYDYGDDSGEPLGTYRVVGIFEDGNTYRYRGVYCSSALYGLLDISSEYELVDTFDMGEDAVYRSAYVPVSGMSSSEIKSLLARLGITGESDPYTLTYYGLSSNLYNDVEDVSEIVSVLNVVFLVSGIVLAVFAALLLLNFVSVSITNKKKEIGILRAVGARGTDVFKIFFSESGVIVGVCTVLALVLTFVLCVVLNSYIMAMFAMIVKVFIFGWLTVALMLAIAVFVAFIGTFVPVYMASRKKPVESIRAL